MTKTVLDWLLSRATEASTYAGLGAMLAGFHMTVSGDAVNAIAGVCAAVAGLIGIILKEKGLA